MGLGLLACIIATMEAFRCKIHETGFGRVIKVSMQVHRICTRHSDIVTLVIFKMQKMKSQLQVDMQVHTMKLTMVIMMMIIIIIGKKILNMLLLMLMLMLMVMMLKL